MAEEWWEQSEADGGRRRRRTNETDALRVSAGMEAAKVCGSGMLVKPHRLQAVLFYSQTPNLTLDYLSLHGGCPVLEGIKWVATVWVWNGPMRPFLSMQRDRSHLEGRMGRCEVEEGCYKENSGAGTVTGRGAEEIVAIFELEVDTGVSLSLFRGDKIWSVLEYGRPVVVSTVRGEIWSVKVNMRVTLLDFKIADIGEKGILQNYRISARDIISAAIVAAEGL